MTKLLSFIIPSYNREHVLQHVLAQLFCQRYKFDFEVIVVDNNSTDDSVRMIQQNYPQVRLFALGENLGAVSRNFAVKQASGTYLMMLDDDSYPVADSVAKGIQVFQKDQKEEIGCVAYNIKRADGSYETAGVYRNFTGCGALFRKSIFDHVGGYPEDYLFYVEEYDLSSRVWDAGFKILNFKELEVIHLKTGVNRDFNRILQQLVKNNLCLWSKYLPTTVSCRQIATELWRYEKIAYREDALKGFVEGKRLGLLEVEKYKTDRSFEVCQETADILLDRVNLRTRIKYLEERIPAGLIFIFNVGKLLSFLLEELRQTTLHILGIVDDNPYMQGNAFENIPIISRDKLRYTVFDGILIGSSSLSLNDVFESELKSLFPKILVARVCDYDCLQEYI